MSRRDRGPRRHRALSPWWARLIAGLLSSGALLAAAHATFMAGSAVTDVRALKESAPRVEERLRAVETEVSGLSMAVQDARREGSAAAEDLRRRLERIEELLMQGSGGE